jgi:hypothetical protein
LLVPRALELKAPTVMAMAALSAQLFQHFSHLEQKWTAQRQTTAFMSN